MAETVSAADLRARLEKGDPVTVLDIRESEDYAEWRIPGALHCDAMEPLAEGRPGPVATVDLPRGRPVVAVCYRGFTSQKAARHLRERGIEAASLAGGMQAWSGAWNLAEVALPGSTTRLLQVRRTGKGCLSYVVASGREALVVDPSVDADVYLDLARSHGWTIRHVVETHVHADHLTRARTLASATGATLHLPRTDRVLFAYEPVDEGTRIKVGATELVALRTPGHTMESTCYHVESRALLTGDTVFLESVGRPDLEADSKQAKARAVALHASLQRVFQLPPHTLVLPCHTGNPVAFDRRPLVATLAQVRARVPLLGMERDAFVEETLARLPPAPPNSSTIVRANERGAWGDLDPAEVEAGANRCALR